MPNPGSRSSRKVPEEVKRRLEVASAMGWEALVESHATHALQFLVLLADRLPYDEALDRYLREMGTPAPMAQAIRTRVLVVLEETDRPAGGPPPLPLAAPRIAEEPEAEEGGWRRYRPDVLVRGAIDRSRRNEQTERYIQLALARAEEGVIGTHIDNAITFVALLDHHMPLDRAVEEYIDAMDLGGSRAQAVLQRTMARLADVHLPELPPQG